MRQFVTQQTIKKSAKKRPEKHQYHGQKSATQQDEYWTGTRTHQSPTQSKKDSSNPETNGTGIFFQNFYRQPFDVFYVFSFDDLDANHSRHDRNHDNSVHMKRLKLEHFINPVPRNGFGFGQNNPEHESND